MIAMLNQLITDKICHDNVPSQKDKLILSSCANGVSKKQISFIHAARSPDVHAMRREVRNLADTNSNLYVYVAYESLIDSNVSEEDYQMLGRLDLSKVPSQLLPKDADYYLCGPVPFMQHQHVALIELGIPQENIHSEAFGTGGVSF